MNISCFTNKLVGNRSRKTKRFLFGLAVVIIPLIQFCIFYIYVNFNSIILAFQKYEYAMDGNGFLITFAGFKNFAAAWNAFTYRKYMIVNSLKLLVCNLLIVTPLALVFAYYIYKGFFGHGFFKVMLFLPHIISGLILSTLFKFMMTDVYVFFAEKITGQTGILGLFDNQATKYGAVLFFTIWMGFGMNVLLYSGAMAGINPAIIESAKLDGAGVAQEFLHIVFPMIFKTFSTFLVIQIVGLFTNQMHLYSFYGGNAGDLATVGYYIYMTSKSSERIAVGNHLSYPELAALGLICTAIVMPSTLILKKLLAKFGPKED